MDTRLLSTRRILVIDDDSMSAKLIYVLLTKRGYSVSTATDGEMGFELAQVLRPNVIILDMRMPIMDGWQFITSYQGTDGPHSPIIVISASVRPQEVNNLTGVASYLTKPFELSDLLGCVQQYLPS
jgi:two-component system, chemotaxis family, chemotaxis protein CheY